MSATKIEQLMDDIAYYYICYSALIFCTPASKWEETVLFDALLHFYLVLLKKKSKEPFRPVWLYEFIF